MFSKTVQIIPNHSVLFHFRFSFLYIFSLSKMHGSSKRRCNDKHACLASWKMTWPQVLRNQEKIRKGKTQKWTNKKGICYNPIINNRSWRKAFEQIWSVEPLWRWALKVLFPCSRPKTSAVFGGRLETFRAPWFRKDKKMSFDMQRSIPFDFLLQSHSFCQGISAFNKRRHCEKAKWILKHGWKEHRRRVFFGLFFSVELKKKTKGEGVFPVCHQETLHVGSEEYLADAQACSGAAVFASLHLCGLKIQCFLREKNHSRDFWRCLAQM